MTCGRRRAAGQAWPGQRAGRALLLCAGTLSGAGYAGQEQLNIATPPASAQQAATPLERSFPAAPAPQEVNGITDALRKALQNTPAFIRDTQLTLKPRSYYYYQEDPNNGVIKQAWAVGGSLEYRSGWLADRFRIGAEVFTSQPAYAPADQDGTLLLAPGQEGYTVLGQAYAQLRVGDDDIITGGRSEYDTPYVNRQFNRMTPNTFQGVSIQGTLHGPLEDRRFDYLFGYLSKIKTRNSTDFVPMSAVLDPNQPAEGTYLAQVLFTAWGSSIGLSNYFTPNNLNIFYAESTWDAKPKTPWGLKLSLQYTDERTVGASPSLSGTPLSGNLGVEAITSYQRSVFTLAYSKTSSAGSVLSPWGSSPSYTNAAIKNRNRAGEQGALVRYSYDFGESVRGLSLAAVYAYGWSAIDPSTGARLQNEHELDLLLDYRIPDTWAKGLWFRLQRNLLLGAGDPEATKELRFIVYWKIPLI